MGSISMARLFAPPKLDVANLPTAAGSLYSPAVWREWDGEKFAGGYGPTQILFKDYWALRERSAQMYETNLYARGIVRRLVTNEINTGLDLEVAPEEAIIGREAGSLDEWSEDIENRWRIWARSPGRCDALGLLGFGRLQAAARLEAILSGDVLVALVQDRVTGLPRVRLFDGRIVQSPPHNPQREGHKIIEGVELDRQGRQVAFWIENEDATWKRLPAWGEKSGRRLAWLVYGSDARWCDVRGTPLLSIVIQSLLELDRYRDAATRKAVINSMVAMFIQKDEERLGTRPLTGAALRRGTAHADAGDGTIRSFRAQEHIPGVVFEELNVGEKPVGMNAQGTDEKFVDFQDALVAAMAWHFEIPPEILTLSFNANYSASQAALNEFKMYLNRVRTDFGEMFCKPIYHEWLVAQCLSNRVTENASEILGAWRSTAEYDVFGAWTFSEWAGHIKPSTDLVKIAKGYEILLDRGLLTYDLASKELTGTKFSKNVKKQKVEREQLAELKEILDAQARQAEHENALELAEASSKDEPMNGGANQGATSAKERQLAESLEALIAGKDVEIRYG